jgi:hypothetical protein
MEAKSINQYTAIWHALKSDRSQRDILIAAAETTIRGAIPIPFLEDIKWVCGQADKLEELRNNALHSPYWGHIGMGNKVTIMPNINLGHVRAGKLFSKNLLKEFRYCRDYCVLLSKFAWQMDCALSDLSLPWPDRPKPPNRGETNVRKQPLQARKAKRPHPPQSSPP